MKRLLPLLLAATFSAAVASPTAPVVVAGQATFHQQGNVFTITNTPNTVINWQSFSVAPGEVTRFVQQGASSAVLNRILGQDPTQILGALQSNGQVFLINPNGVMFGKDARIDVAGLTASTLNLTDADFLAGRRKFSAGPVAGDISNQGAINAQSGGHVFLVAPNVENTGIITAPNGDVVLAAGRQVQLVDSRDPDMHVVVSAPDDKAVNLGQVISQGGRIGIYGALVKQRGEVNANSAVVGANGKIVLKASGDTLLEAGSKTTATGAGNGGSVHVLGNRVAMTGDAKVDASGGASGGTVLMGGDYRGQNPLYASAQQTWMGKDASIKADAGNAGKGGKVILWATDATRAFGAISARGGATSGDGGFIETSADYLDVNGLRIDTLASNGKAGLWLLDPLNITVGLPNCPTTCVNIDRVQASMWESADGNSGLISVETLLAATSDIVLEAKNHIRFNDTLDAGTRNITALAGGNIDVDAPITTSGGNIVLQANVTSFAGENLNGSVTINKQIRTGGGSVKLDGASVNVNAMTDPAVAAIDSAGGRIDIIASPAAEGTINIKGLIESGGGDVDLSGPNLVIGDTLAPNKGGIDSSGGHIELTADTLKLYTGVKAGVPGDTSQVTIMPLELARPILVDELSSGDVLHLSNNELGKIYADRIQIGSSSRTGDITWALVGKYTNYGVMAFATQGKFILDNALETFPALGEIAPVERQIDISTGSIDISGNGSIKSHLISLSPISGNTAIEIASVKEAGKFALTPAELGRIGGDTLLLGNSGDTAGLTVKAGTTVTMPSGLRSLSLNTGGPLNIDGSIELTHIDGALLASSFGNKVTIGSGGAMTAPFAFVHAASLDLLGMIDADGVLIQADDTVSSIQVGTGAADSLGILGLSQDELQRISATHLAISGEGGETTKRIDVVGATNWGVIDTTLKLAVGEGDISIKAPLSTVGAIALQSGGQIDQTASGGITASLLSIAAPTASSVQVFLDAAGANNNVRELTASGIQHLAFDTTGTLQIGGSNGIAVAPQSVNGWIDINAVGELQMAKPIYAPDATVRLGGSSVVIGSDAPVLSFTESTAPHANIFADYVNVEARGGEITLLDNGYIDSFHVNLVADKMDFSPLAGIHTPSEGGVSISTFDYNKSIHLGQGALDEDGITLGLTEDELRIIDASFISIGGVGEGATTDQVHVSGALDLSPTSRLINLSLYAENGVTIDAPVTVPEGVEIRTNGSVQLNDSIRANLRGITINGDAVLGAGLLKAAQQVRIFAQSGIGGLDAPIHTETPSLYLSNNDTDSETGTPINVINNAAAPGQLYIEKAVQEYGGNGSITIENFGGMNVAQVTASAGQVDLITHSPMVIEGSVATTSGDIKLIAEGTDGNITLNTGATVTSGTGDITLNAGGAITAPEGSITTDGITTLTASVVTTPPPPPTVEECLATSAITGCDAVLDAALDACIVDQGGDYCQQLLPTMPMCIADETKKGCTVVLPTLEQCLATRTLEGCSVVLPTPAECAAAPSKPGCVVSNPGPTLEQCIANPSISGCSSVLPNLAQCIADKNRPGCSVVLPSLTACIANKALAGCEVVLPNLAACVADKTAPGCDAVLPKLAACIADKTTPGCEVILPKLAACIANKATPGCEVVLPNIAACVADKTAPGCDVVLPNLPACIADKATAGCEVVLPKLVACIADKTTPGCEVVLPSMAACIANKAAPGCAVVLPTLAACIANKAAAGCEVVLPNMAMCIANKATDGCEVVLPSMTACIADKSSPGCEVILPPLAMCIADKSTIGCEAVLPLISQCIANPTLGGCDVVLPTLNQCIANKSLPGCEITLPTMAECIASPTAGGCTVVLPKLEQCAVNPSLTGCVAVLPKPDFCSTHPTDPRCVVFNPGGQQSGQGKTPVAEAVQNSVALINSKTPQTKAPGATVQPTAGDSTQQAPGSGSDQSQGQQQGEPEKPADKEQAPAAADNSGVKNEKPATKTYCN